MTQLTPLLISILLFVSGKLKPLEPGFKNVTSFLITLHQPVNNLKDKLNQQKLFIASLPSIHFSNLALQAENGKLKTENLLLRNKLNLKSFELPTYNTVPVRIIKIDQTISATSDHTDLIKPGMPLTQSTNIVGIVQKVSSSIIYILPLTNKDASFPVQTNHDIKGNYLFQDQIPQMANIANKNVPNQMSTVFTLPTEQIPEGLIVGEVTQALTQPSNPIQRVEIKLSANPSEASVKEGLHIILSP
jgi:cell shape-determining protein MreC